MTDQSHADRSGSVGRLRGCGTSIKSGICGETGICAACWSERQKPYDSRPDTHEHIAQVRERLLAVAYALIERAHSHDRSKLEEPELSVFNEYTPKLRDSTYGSDEYKAFLEGMGEGLSHHYAVNDHHPEHFSGGVSAMNLVQVIEMLADWKAATLRHADGSLYRSIIQNRERFGYGDEFMRLLLNTASYFGWLDRDQVETDEKGESRG